MMFMMTMAIVISAAAVPQILSGLERSRAIAAARHLAQQCGIARFQAVGHGSYVAVRFTPLGDDYVTETFVDGNRNGVRAIDIAAGVDAPFGSRVLLSTNFSGARIAIDPSIGLGTDPIRLSGSALLSFSPDGTSTAGTIYVLGRDRTQLAVRVLGTTGRTRVLRYQRATASWERP